MKNTRRTKKLRPTSSIVKNALFNILGDLEGLDFVDLFAGTGQVGLEAERRGANVTFVEKNPRLAREIKKRSKGKVITGDVMKVLGKLKADIVFADPPYSFEAYETLIKRATDALRPGGIFILEHDRRRSFGAPEERTYGDTVLSMWRKEA